jgi:hypothetical protein
MSTAAQVIANRQNAAQSTGPSTPEGKAASSKNATRHGLSGAFTVLPHEIQDDFDQLATRMRDEFKPEGQNETFLVDQMIHARWKISRIQRFENEAFDQMLSAGDPQLGPDARIVAAIAGSSVSLDKLQRYSAAAERSYYKALRELESSRLRNQKTESKMLSNYIGKVVFAPVPGQHEQDTFNASVKAFMQNEANRTSAPQSTPPPGKSALRR